MADPKTKHALQKAQALIKEKRYKEAYTLLKKVDHPKAREWQTKLEARGIGKSSSTVKKQKKQKPKLVLHAHPPAPYPSPDKCLHP